MSNTRNKKMSLVLINTNSNTHTAMKNILLQQSLSKISTKDTRSSRKKEYNEQVTTAYQHFKNNQMKYPFALSETRFLWQDNNAKHKLTYSIELTGNMIKYSNKKNNIVSMEDYHNMSQSSNSKSLSKASHRKILENKNSSRVMDMSNDVYNILIIIDVI